MKKNFVLYVLVDKFYNKNVLFLSILGFLKLFLRLINPTENNKRKNRRRMDYEGPEMLEVERMDWGQR